MSDYSIDQTTQQILEIGFDYGMLTLEESLAHWHAGNEVFITLLQFEGVPVPVPFVDCDQQDSFVEDLLPRFPNCSFMDYRFCDWDVFGVDPNMYNVRMLEEYFAIQHGLWRMYDDAVRYVAVDVENQKEISCHIQVMEYHVED